MSSDDDTEVDDEEEQWEGEGDEEEEEEDEDMMGIDDDDDDDGEEEEGDEEDDEDEEGSLMDVEREAAALDKKQKRVEKEAKEDLEESMRASRSEDAIIGIEDEAARLPPGALKERIASR